MLNHVIKFYFCYCYSLLFFTTRTTSKMKDWLEKSEQGVLE